MCKLLTVIHKIFIFVRKYGKYDNKSNTIMNNNKYLVLRSVIFLKINQLHLIFPSWTNPRSERGVIKIYWACRHYNYTSYCALVIPSIISQDFIITKFYQTYFYSLIYLKDFLEMFHYKIGKYWQGFNSVTDQTILVVATFYIHWMNEEIITSMNPF